MSPEQARAERDRRRGAISSRSAPCSTRCSPGRTRSPRRRRSRRCGACRRASTRRSSSCAPTCRRPLVDIVSTMLAKEPEDRFPDAGRLHEALLGFFYATGERFGANDLAEFLEPFHEEQRRAELEASAVLEEEPIGANERTPVEVPHTTSTRSRTGVGAPPAAREGRQRPGRARARRAARGHGARAHLHGHPSDDAARRIGAGPRGAGALRRAAARAGGVAARRRLRARRRRRPRHRGRGARRARDPARARRGRGGLGRHPPRAHPRRQRRRARSGTSGSRRSSPPPRRSPARPSRQVAVSHLTGRVLRNAFATEELPGAGRTAPEGGRVVTSAQPPDGAYGRFVGRRDELKQLGDILADATRQARADRRHPGRASGIGKTRLLAEMERRLSKGDYNVGFYVASCPHNGADVPWSGLTAMLQVLCGIQEGDDEERIREVLPRLRALGLQRRRVRGRARPARRGARRAERGRRRGRPRSCAPPSRAWCRASATIASTASPGTTRRRWTSSPPRRLARQRAGRAGGLRAVLSCLATRSDPPPLLAAHPHFYRLTLGELSDDDSARLMSARIGATLPAARVARLLPRARRRPPALPRGAHQGAHRLRRASASSAAP